MPAAAPGADRKVVAPSEGGPTANLKWFAALALTACCLALAACAPVVASGTYPLVGDPAFDEDSLSADTRIWYDRFLTALNNPDQYPEIRQRAEKGDLYELGRFVSTDITTTLTVFRLTGDLRLLDYVDEIMQLARGQLEDYNDDGYPNWRWLTHPDETEYYGDDYNVMDEIMTHAMVAEVAWAFKLNQDQTSPAGVDYQERARFWNNYRQQWESKWRERNGVPSGFPFIRKNLIHPYVDLIRYLWYSYRLSNDQDYLTEAARLANNVAQNEFRSFSTPNGPGLVFPHGIITEEPELNYLPPTDYGRYTTQTLMDLVLDSFPPFTAENTLVPIANTIATKIIDNGSIDFAPTIGGSSSLAGIGMPPDGYRIGPSDWAIYPYGEYAAYDSSGTISTINQQIYREVEQADLENPTQIAMPAAMVIYQLLDN